MQMNKFEIEKCRSSHLRRKLLEKGGDLTLEQTFTIARAFEQCQHQASGMKGGKNLEVSVSKVSVQKPKQNMNIACHRCGLSGHIQSDPSCTARGQECKKCHKVDHYVRCCKSPTFKTPKNTGSRKSKQHVRMVKSKDLEDSDEAYAFILSTNSAQETSQAFTIGGVNHSTVATNIGGVQNIRVIVDSGASCNVIDSCLWEELKRRRVKCISKKSDKKIISMEAPNHLRLWEVSLQTLQWVNHR